MVAGAQSVSLNPDTAAQVARQAKARGQSLEAFVNDAVSDALAEQAPFDAAMAEADRDFEDGRIRSHEEVLALLGSMRGDAEEEMARRNQTA